MPNSRQPVALLVRHGHDILSDSGIFVSWTDVPLTDEGRTEAHETIKKLEPFDVQIVYTSPLLRCLEMAEMMSDDPIQERSLLPWNRGILTLTPEKEGRDALNLFVTNPDVRIPGGESRIEVETRLEKFFIPALERAEKETTVFFTHHSVIDVLNSLLKGERDEEPENLVKPSGIVAVYVDGDSYRLEPIWKADKKSVVGMS